MKILHFKVVLAAIFIRININNRKTRPYSQFYNLGTSKYTYLLKVLNKHCHLPVYTLLCLNEKTFDFLRATVNILLCCSRALSQDFWENDRMIFFLWGTLTGHVHKQNFRAQQKLL